MEIYYEGLQDTYAAEDEKAPSARQKTHKVKHRNIARFLVSRAGWWKGGVSSGHNYRVIRIF